MVYIARPHGSKASIKHYLASVEKNLDNKVIQYVKKYL